MKVILLLSLLVAFNCITMRNLFAVKKIVIKQNNTDTEEDEDVPANDSNNSTTDSNDEEEEEKQEEIVIEIKPSIIWSRQPMVKKPVIYLYP